MFNWSWNIRTLFLYFYFFQLFHQLNRDRIDFVPQIDASRTVAPFYGAKGKPQLIMLTEDNNDFKGLKAKLYKDDDDPIVQLRQAVI